MGTIISLVLIVLTSCILGDYLRKNHLNLFRCLNAGVLGISTLLIIGNIFHLAYSFPFYYLIPGFRDNYLFIILTSFISSYVVSISESKVQKLITAGILGVLIYFHAFFIVSPILIKNDLQNLVPKLSKYKIYEQTTDFTCGPTAAATALRVFGIHATEGQLAIQAKTSSKGTDLCLLYNSLKSNYGSVLDFQIGKFSIPDLKESDTALLVLKLGFINYHCVAVIKFDEDSIVIADPADGLPQWISIPEFKKQWTREAILINRKEIK